MCAEAPGFRESGPCHFVWGHKVILKSPLIDLPDYIFGRKTDISPVSCCSCV